MKNRLKYVPAIVFLIALCAISCQTGLAADGSQEVYKGMKLTMQDLIRIQSGFDKVTAQMDISMQDVNGIPYRVVTFTGKNGCVLKEYYSLATNKLAMTEFKCQNKITEIDKTTSTVETSEQVINGITYKVLTYKNPGGCTLEEFYTKDNELFKSQGSCDSCTLKLVFDDSATTPNVAETHNDLLLSSLDSKNGSSEYPVDLMKVQSSFDKISARMDESTQLIYGTPYRIITYYDAYGCILKEFYTLAQNKLMMTELKCCNNTTWVDNTVARTIRSQRVVDGVVYDVITYMDENNCTLEEFYTLRTHELVKSESYCCSCTLKRSTGTSVTPPGTGDAIRTAFPGLRKLVVTCHDQQLIYDPITDTWTIIDKNGRETVIDEEEPNEDTIICYVTGASELRQ